MTKGRFRLLVLGSYLLVLVILLLGLFRARSWSQSVYGDSVARSQWDSFRDDVSQQADEDVPVRRRVPQSAEPPGLVLLRDYFVECSVISVVLTSALFGTFAFFVGGVVVRPSE